MKHTILAAGFLAALGGCNMAEDGIVTETDKYTIGGPGFDAAAFDIRHLEQNMSKLERVGRTDCGAFALELYVPTNFSNTEMWNDVSSESEFYLFWVVRVTEQLAGEELLVILPTAYDGFDWRADQLDANGRWVEMKKTPPAGGGNPHDKDARLTFSGKDLLDDIVLPTGLSKALYDVPTHPENFIPGRYRIHTGRFSAQIEGQSYCVFDTTVWEVNIRR